MIYGAGAAIGGARALCARGCQAFSCWAHLASVEVFAREVNSVVGALSVRALEFAAVVEIPQNRREFLDCVFLKELRACFRGRPVQQLKLFQAFFGQLDAITDVYRRKHVEAKYRAPSIPNEKTAIELEDEAVLCNCFKELIPTLKIPGADYS